MILSQPKSRRLLPDLLRCLACPAVLLFHMQLLPGGYLAVCCFFTLSGYLMAASLLGPESPALGRYYKGRFLRLWLPAAAAVLLTLGISFGLMGHAWPGMKQESLSVLLGFHNFRQIALQDNYFAPHSITPLQPLWYTSILMQFTLVFPPVFLLLRKAGPTMRTLLIHGLTIAALLAFGHFCLKQNLWSVVL
ncbi:MAG: acyltransferase [Oscillospiraceae bacterium]|nr:acyltransferase [Oscillospiraceae bacterium]